MRSFYRNEIEIFCHRLAFLVQWFSLITTWLNSYLKQKKRFVTQSSSDFAQICVTLTVKLVLDFPQIKRISSMIVSKLKKLNFNDKITKKLEIFLFHEVLYGSHGMRWLRIMWLSRINFQPRLQSGSQTKRGTLRSRFLFLFKHHKLWMENFHRSV